MIKPPKRFNSKAFLVIYLAVIGLILTTWMSRLDFYPADKRKIPISLQSYLESPIKPLPQFLLTQVGENTVFTNASFLGKWSFVYFTQEKCIPACSKPLATLKALRSHLSVQSIQFLLINFDVDDINAEALAKLKTIDSYQNFQILTADAEHLAPLIKTFNFLFLKTETEDHYYLEQEHKIFLVDPKGRFYAAFKPPFNIKSLLNTFIDIRLYYGRSE